MDLVNVIANTTTRLATTIDVFDHLMIHNVYWKCQ